MTEDRPNPNRAFIGTTFPNDTERLDVRRARQLYAWNWFDFHARQRTAMVNYYLIGAGILATGYGTVLPDSRYAGMAVGLAGCFLSVLFYFLERRNAQMVRWGERVLRNVEDELLFRPDVTAPGEPRGILLWEQAALDGSLADGRYFARDGGWYYNVFGRYPFRVEHGVWLPRCFGMIGVVFALLFFVALFHHHPRVPPGAAGADRPAVTRG